MQRPTTATFKVLASYNAAPHNRYQPHPAEPAQHTTCSNTGLGLLKVGIMIPETCWESVDNKHLTVASCWFSLSLHNISLISSQNQNVSGSSYTQWKHTRFMFKIFFSGNRAVRDTVEKYGPAGEATDNIILRRKDAICIEDNKAKIQTVSHNISQSLLYSWLIPSDLVKCFRATRISLRKKNRAVKLLQLDSWWMFCAGSSFLMPKRPSHLL